MFAVILAGGFGTRISEETIYRPKPMINIGNMPILWHIMKGYSNYGINEFIVCCGYKGFAIKEYFANYFLHNNDITIDVEKNTVEIHKKKIEPWKITIVDTGEKTMTGGRLKRVKKYLDEKPFCFTYGDGVSDINIKKLINFHNSHNCPATITAVQPQGRFGQINFNSNNEVVNFKEKPDGDGSWINGGFFILEPKVIDRISDDSVIWEKGPLEGLAKDRQISAYKHYGFWHPMDTLRDKNYLDKLWESGNAPWKTWK